jgi:hypothetical protein
MRDVQRQPGAVPDGRRAALEEQIARTNRVLSQKTKDRSTLYALYVPEVECLFLRCDSKHLSRQRLVVAASTRLLAEQRPLNPNRPAGPGDIQRA